MSLRNKVVYFTTGLLLAGALGAQEERTQENPQPRSRPQVERKAPQTRSQPQTERQAPQTRPQAKPRTQRPSARPNTRPKAQDTRQAPRAKPRPDYDNSKKYVRPYNRSRIEHPNPGKYDSRVNTRRYTYPWRQFHRRPITHWYFSPRLDWQFTLYNHYRYWNPYMTFWWDDHTWYNTHHHHTLTEADTYDVTPPLGFEEATITYFRTSGTKTIRAELTNYTKEGVELVVLKDNLRNGISLDSAVYIEDDSREDAINTYIKKGGKKRYQIPLEDAVMLYEQLEPEVRGILDEHQFPPS
ncbi:hypothetical protein GOV11_03265 [Candidatus Woesearchaeota archaeon]|nr:hypothetical protein [Candidatus Woesearchaeota archaeon]